jgi:hypothetical protein
MVLLPTPLLSETKKTYLDGILLNILPYACTPVSSVFYYVITCTFQIIFYVKIYINDIFLFFKNYFWHQHIKTIQNIQTILNFNKKKFSKILGTQRRFFYALGPKFTLLLQSADNNYRITHVIFLLVDLVCREINNMGFSKWHVTVSISFRLWSLIVVLTKGHRMPAGWRACAAWDPKMGGCFHCCHVEDYADEWWLTGKAQHWICFWRPKMLICMPYCLVMLNHPLWLIFFFGEYIL